VFWVVAQGGHFWRLNHVFFCPVWSGWLRNVRLAALDLKEISGVYLEGSELDPGISENLGFSLKFTCFSLFP